MSDPRKPIFDAVRVTAPVGLFNDPGNVLALDNLLDAFSVPRAGQVTKPVTPAPSPTAAEPRWMAEARKLIGQREVKGLQHSKLIVGWWHRLGARWFNDDETPWCGAFVAHCLDAAGYAIPSPALFPRALAWKDWGKECPRAVGAVVVFQRPGGGHVGFLVGESPDNFYVLGGNQSDAVTITPIAKARAVAIRWPLELGLPRPNLPQMHGGTVSVNEA